MYYVYLIKSMKDGSHYIGYTSDLRKRFREHNAGKSRYTKNKVPFELLYYEAYRCKSDAKFREKNLKRFAQSYNHLKKRAKNSLGL